ncbi:replication protein A 70 [Osmia lignaria lignaria]|uniref:replication protein A 70 kDa DNA-binding subunit n=1 Tax=Osmia lignaria TaxID=473952 RepID=UPI001478C665|nr:replication protein A 70 kDa DNA-binding subunit [Osmia lignaria]XP_034177571.1 replication protein A 70 kDa DNA-binding subunit [Osmia lignaria]XP_034177573.1 replication protein A 70 kDa DNA-binding subunit [Osmia lignaria]
MYSLTEGALDKIINGVDVDKPILQILGHKKLASSSSGERYRLLVSDGKRVNSFTMLATQLNSMISDNILTEFSICQINRYAISMVNNAGKQKRVMVILNIEVKVPGKEVGHKIGNPTSAESESDSKPVPSVQSKLASHPPQQNDSASSKHNPPQSSTNDIQTTPIIALSPYQNRWVVRARVVSKSGIRTWSNSRGEGKLFSMDLVDESGEIRCTAFRDQCDKFYEMLEIGKVYYISRATLKTANKQFNNLKNDYEMNLTGDSEIIPCHDNEKDIPTLQFDFQPIGDIEKKEKNDLMDVLGIVKSCADLQLLTSRTTGREMKKRDIHLVDDSNTMVCLTLWGTEAEDFDGSNNPVVAVKGARIGEFNGGKNLSALSSTVMQVDPDIPEAHRLRGWFKTIGCNEDMKSVSRAFGGANNTSGPLITFKEATDLELGHRGTDMYVIKATVNMIRIENALYKACPSEGCKKKLIDQANDMYRCEKCDKEYPNFRYRLLASLSLADWTNNQWATAFSEEAEKILGVTAQELGELQENDNDAYLEKFGDATFKSFIFKIRIKLETFSDEKRLKATCAAVSPIDYKTYNNHLITQIKELAGINKV